jgi:transcriptional regulator with XRE-family HTH domain
MVATMPARRRGTPPNHPLRLWREAHNVSQEDLAKDCGVSQAMISYIEWDKKLPWRDVLLCLCQQTGLPLDAFLRWQDFMAEIGGEGKFLRKYGRRRPPKQK